MSYFDRTMELKSKYEEPPEYSNYSFNNWEVSYTSEWGTVQNNNVFNNQQAHIISYLEERIKYLEEQVNKLNQEVDTSHYID